MPTYYYLDAEKHQQGPVSEEELSSTVLTPELWVWTDGLDNWTHAGEVPALKCRLSGEPMPPPVPPVPVAPEEPKSHLALSILATVLCFPFGIAALLASTKVQSLYNDGLYDEAAAKSRLARNLSIAGIVVGVIVNVAYVFLCIPAMETSVPSTGGYYYYY